MRHNETLRLKEGFKGQKAIIIPRKILSQQCVKNEILNTLYVTDIGYYPKARFHYRQRIHGADQHILIYCHEGSGHVRIQKRAYEIHQGDFFIVPMKVAHLYAADEDNPWTIYWVHFKGSVSNAIISRLQKQMGGHKGFIRYSDRSISLFNEMYAQLERGYSSDNLMYSNMCMSHFLTTFLFNDKYNPSGPVKDEVDRSIDFLSDNIGQRLSLEEVAASVNLSPSHFSYLFNKKTGFSPMEYFNHLKVQQACQHLLFTNSRIKEVAFEVGISDPYYFSRMFTKVMGMSPKEYKEKRMH